VPTGILISFFQNRSDARKCLWALNKKGFRRAAVLHRSSGGNIDILDCFKWTRIIGLLALTLGSGLVALFTDIGKLDLRLFGEDLPLHTLIVSGSIIGITLGLAWLKRSRFGIATRIIDQYVHSLMPDEAALILQAPVDAMKSPMAIIRDKSETLPTIFILHPGREHRGASRDLAGPLSDDEVSRRARFQGIEHQLQNKDSGKSELLHRLKKEGQWFQEICTDLTEACRLEQGASPVAEWIIDNEFLVAKAVRDILVNLPKSYYRELPVLTSHKHWTGFPCVYELAKEMVFDNESRLNRENIISFISSYQTLKKLSIAELWAVPQMLRIALIESILDLAIRVHNDMRERQLAAFWANRFIAANRRDSSQIFSILAELDDRHPEPSLYFGSQLISLLYDQAATLAPVESWLERKLGKSANDINFSEQNRQAHDQLLIEAAFTSIRQLVQIDWRDIFEELSWVEKIMTTDPAGIYPAMDFQTRDKYRQVIKHYAQRSGRTEDDVARTAIELARSTESHVGTLLFGPGKARLDAKLDCRENRSKRFRAFLRANHCAVYLGGLGAIFLGIYLFMFNIALTNESIAARFGFAILLTIPVSQLALEILNYFLTRLVRPRPLSKMDFEKTGIPDEFRTLVVVPTLLTSDGAIREEIEKLEIRFMANRDTNLRFGLFTDYTDSTLEHNEEDEALLQLAQKSINGLNRRYDTDTFFLFHRERTWSNTEQKFIGWERKRGKLEELNQLLDGSSPDSANKLVYAGNPEQLDGIRFIITLDSDTQLPHGTARRMIETLAHPLNQPQIDESGQIKRGTYTILQPRVTPSLQSTSKSPFSQIYADAVGVDPYTRVVSDVYQDLSGEGSYHGKGIYDVRAFSRILSNNFPDELVLSHDLIEGAHVRTALVSDIELFYDFPQDYLGFITRLRRWIRGDWQIFPWIFPWVPKKGGGFRKNPISIFNRWKVLDNLRRSLLPTFNLALLIAAWLTSQQAAMAVMMMIGLQIFFNPVSQILSAVTTRKGIRGFSVSLHLNHLQRALAEIAMLPHQAWVTFAAILQAWYRLFISHRKLLEWTTAYAAQTTVQRRRRLFAASLLLASASAVAISLLLSEQQPDNLVQASPWLLLWFFSPFFGWLLTARPIEKNQRELLPAKEILFLRRINRLTWRFFADFVNAETSWLPPDNYQVSHQDQLALRTSPTNIGFAMLSTVAACDSGYITQVGTLDKLESTMQSIEKLERFEGHLLNWYDIGNLTPLEPRYVSTVDSGNFLGALWTLQQGLKDQFTGEIISRSTFDGLHDTGRILLRRIRDDNTLKPIRRDLTALLEQLDRPPRKTVDQLKLLRQSADAGKNITNSILEIYPEPCEVSYWCKALVTEFANWSEMADQYLSWIELLGQQQSKLAETAIRNLSEINEDLSQAPSIRNLARGESASGALLNIIRENAHTESPSLAKWAGEVLDRFAVAQRHASAFRQRHEDLLSSIRNLAGGMNLKFLYHPERKLFSIGYNVSSGEMDKSYYDLLASEARFGGFVAIARGDIPMEHWFTMGRPHTLVGRHRVLLSWTGTMFEYLMPQIFLRSYRYSLLDKAIHNAVDTQIEYGRKNGIPWGISESAFGDLDFNKTYQYKAFGVPKLGLKRVLEDQLVVSPYSTLMAVGIMPKETVQNLRDLDQLGMLDKYGYFEAIDFRRKPERDGQRGVKIQAYMAHHQGMGFLALTNFLHNNLFQRRFHADPRARAFEPLLQERIPTLPPLQLTATRERTTSLVESSSDIPASGTFETPHTSMPKTQILCNGHYDLMITHTGGGYSKWKGQEISRWRADRTNDCWGVYCYLNDLAERKTWSATYHPIGGEPDYYNAELALDRAIFRRLENDVQLETEVLVAPEDDVEIRRMTLINRSSHAKRLNLTSYIELSMTPHAADRAHPAFNKLFIQTEAVEEKRTLLAYRRSRSEEAEPFFVAHRFVNDQEQKHWRFETDRSQFIGRGQNLATARGASSSLGNNDGFVLDPVLCLRETVSLEPSERVSVAMIIAAGDSRQKVLDLAEKYNTMQAVNRAMDFAWRSAQIELRQLHILPDEARRFQQLADHLIFPNNLLRAPAETLEENRKGQSGLWPYAISGDLPILLVSIDETRDIGLVRQLLQAHTYWRRHGFLADLVILNEESESYEQPLRERLVHLIQAHSMFAGRDQPSGIYLRSAEQMPDEDLRLLKAAASVFLVAARGSLSQQLGVPRPTPVLPPLFKKSGNFDSPSPPLPDIELLHHNGYGGFTPDGKEYVIELKPGVSTPAPWVNVMANPDFGALVSETGAGFSWYGNSQRNRINSWSNDPVIDPPSEAIYLRDEVTGDFWTATSAPIRNDSPYRCRHGAGYTIFEHNHAGTESELTMFVPVDSNNSPVRIQRLRLKNKARRKRTISVTWYTELTLGEHREVSQMHAMTHWDSESRILLARNCYHPEYGNRVTFFAMTPKPDSWAGDRTAFIGRNRTMTAPQAMLLENLNNHGGAGCDPCAALQTTIELAPDETEEVLCITGQAESVEQARLFSRTFRDHSIVESSLTATCEWWDRLLGTIRVTTPEPAADILINRWLLYQSLSCRIWGRSAFYQSGGAFGYRDQLQDVMAFLFTRPELAREQILLAASRQFREGDVQHWWHPPTGAGIRSRISDDLLWLPFVTSQYVRSTGDADILNIDVPYLSAPLLEPGQHEVFSAPEITFEQGTIFEHCQRAVRKGLTSGPNGLPLIGTGDWNDGMNLVGADGRGESVWLGWFLVEILAGMAYLADRLGKPELEQEYRQKRNDLVQQIEKVAWDGAWYQRGTFDDGSPLGSSRCDEAKIDSLPQSWAWLTGAGNRERAEQAIESAWEHLILEDERLVLLFEPPFNHSEQNPGYIKGYPPGVRENGGQYTHAALWFAMALARKGDGNRAVKLLNMMSPMEHTRDREAAAHYGLEPYAIAADIYRLPGRVGRGGWSWYTGSAAWTYRAWVEEIFGLKQIENTLHIHPVIPQEWESFCVEYRHGDAHYRIDVENPEHVMSGIASVELDGRYLENKVIPLTKEPGNYHVRVRLGGDKP